MKKSKGPYSTSKLPRRRIHGVKFQLHYKTDPFGSGRPKTPRASMSPGEAGSQSMHQFAAHTRQRPGRTHYSHPGQATPPRKQRVGLKHIGDPKHLRREGARMRGKFTRSIEEPLLFIAKAKLGHAEKEGVTERDFDSKTVEEATEHEHEEHKATRKQAKQIGLDHLAEDKDYYKKLKRMEKGDIFDLGKVALAEGNQELLQACKAELDNRAFVRWMREGVEYGIKKGIEFGCHPKPSDSGGGRSSREGAEGTGRPADRDKKLFNAKFGVEDEDSDTTTSVANNEWPGRHGHAGAGDIAEKAFGSGSKASYLAQVKAANQRAKPPSSFGLKYDKSVASPSHPHNKLIQQCRQSGARLFGKPKLTHVPKSKLTATQRNIDPLRVKQYAGKELSTKGFGAPGPVRVLKVGSKHYVLNGHHRAAAQGTHVLAHVYEHKTLKSEIIAEMRKAFPVKNKPMPEKKHGSKPPPKGQIQPSTQGKNGKDYRYQKPGKKPFGGQQGPPQMAQPPPPPMAKVNPENLARLLHTTTGAIQQLAAAYDEDNFVRYFRRKATSLIRKHKIPDTYWRELHEVLTKDVVKSWKISQLKPSVYEVGSELRSTVEQMRKSDVTSLPKLATFLGKAYGVGKAEVRGLAVEMLNALRKDGALKGA